MSPGRSSGLMFQNIIKSVATINTRFFLSKAFSLLLIRSRTVQLTSALASQISVSGWSHVSVGRPLIRHESCNVSVVFPKSLNQIETFRELKR